MSVNVTDRNAGFAAAQPQVWGFDQRTRIDSKSYGAPGAKIFYVDPNNTQAVDAGNLGEDPTVPLATIDAAVTLARAYMGDTIVVGPNDAWRYSAHVRDTAVSEAVVIPMTKGGIRIVGMSTNPLGLSWNPGADNGTCLTVYAADVLVEGFAFYPAAYANCTGIYAEWGGVASFADNLTVRKCFFDSNLDYGISLDYAYFCHIYSNYFHNVALVALHNPSVIGDPDYCAVHDNTFMACTAAINFPTTDECAIYNNRIYGDGTGADNFINLTGGNDNMVSDNYLACTILQYDTTCSDATSGAWIFNHCTNGEPVAPPT